VTRVACLERVPKLATVHAQDTRLAVFIAEQNPSCCCAKCRRYMRLTSFFGPVHVCQAMQYRSKLILVPPDARVSWRAHTGLTMHSGSRATLFLPLTCFPAHGSKVGCPGLLRLPGRQRLRIRAPEPTLVAAFRCVRVLGSLHANSSFAFAFAAGSSCCSSRF